MTKLFRTIAMLSALYGCSDSQPSKQEQLAPSAPPGSRDDGTLAAPQPRGASGYAHAPRMRVFIDPATGALREQPAGSSVLSTSQPQTVSSTSDDAGLVELDSPHGGRMVRLDGRQRHLLTAQCSDTAVHVDCAQATP